VGKHLFLLCGDSLTALGGSSCSTYFTSLNGKHYGQYLNVEQSEFVPANDRKGWERPGHYVTQCPFSLSRLVKATDSGQVVHKPDKQPYRAFFA
jgi:hypothetical protein